MKEIPGARNKIIWRYEKNFGERGRRTARCALGLQTTEARFACPLSPPEKRRTPAASCRPAALQRAAPRTTWRSWPECSQWRTADALRSNPPAVNKPSASFPATCPPLSSRNKIADKQRGSTASSLGGRTGRVAASLPVCAAQRSSERGVECRAAVQAVPPECAPWEAKWGSPECSRGSSRATARLRLPEGR